MLIAVCDVLLLPLLLAAELVVVVSPLLSLMHDQVSRLPACLPGAMLQGIMSRAEVQEVRRGQGGARLCCCQLPADRPGSKRVARVMALLVLLTSVRYPTSSVACHTARMCLNQIAAVSSVV